jgi:S1-C subfamily serine protease
MKGLGTGMIIDSEGRILTENHVVAGATTIKVLLSNGDEYPVKVVGTGLKTDLAVIQINAGKQLDDWCQFHAKLGLPCARASHSGAVLAASERARIAHVART